VSSFSELSQYELDTAFADLLPLEYCVEKNIAPLGKVPEGTAGPVTIGALTPGDTRLASEVEKQLRRTVRLVQLNAFEIRRALAVIHQLPVAEDDSDAIALDAGREIRFEPNQSPREILADLLAVAIRTGASDIHVESYPADVDLRFRIDGVLRQVPTPLSPENAVRVISRLKVLCGVDFAENRRALDGRFTTIFRENGVARRIDLRVTFLPGPSGAEVAIRVLDRNRFILDLDGLGISPDIAKRYRALTRMPHGLLLAVGPTGVGKTTTLYASVKSLQHDNVKIVTVEDPIEYEFTKVNQKNVTRTMGFADWLRTFLRANPDVILVGEIRDSETAEIAVRAATTGHLILSTLHTGDAISAIGRLRALGAADDFLSDVLVGVLAQRLVRKVCEACAEPCEPEEAVWRRFYDAKPKGTFRRGRGCAACAGTGYSGQTGVYELLVRTEAIVSEIARGTTVPDLRHIARREGWVPLIEDALAKAAAGVTTLEDVARKIGVKNPL